MCGIAGYSGKLCENTLEKMAAALTHRGPDNAGFYHSATVHLAHRRLSVVDLSLAAAQPLISADRKIVVVFNGEIYNHRELRTELAKCGHRFITDHADSEVLIYGYREWGAALPEKLDGMWAFAIYDHSAQKLFCSRDRFGKKPLFYTRQNGVFIFGSELTALRACSGCQFDLDFLALQKYFAYGFIPAPRTLFRQVSQLPAAHNLCVDLTDNSLTVERYWRYAIEPDALESRLPEDELAEKIRATLQAAVRKRLAADVPVGVLLSGGIDSSAVAALAAHEQKIRSFSIGFREASYDESRFAARVAEYIGSEHFLTVVAEREVAENVLPLLQRLDHPFADDSILPSFLVCRAAREKITVALGGDGGDELFGGYEPLRYWQWAQRYRRYLPKFLHPAISALIDRFPVSQNYLAMTYKLKRFFRAASGRMAVWIPALLAPLSIAEIAGLLAAPASPEEIYSEAIATWESCQSSHPLDRMTQYYIELYLPEQLLAKVDRASMLNSLELRCPFLDKDLADLARKIPASRRVRNGLMGGGETKYLLKKSLAGILPTDILYRKKQGFSPPAARWWRTGELALNFPLSVGDTAFAQQKLRSHQSLRHDENLYLWSQLTLENFVK